MPERLRVLGLLDNASPLGQPRRLAARARCGHVPRACALAARGRRRDRRGQPDRKRDARRRRADRRRRPRAGDGPDARAARAARLLGADRDQRGTVRRLVDLRASDHRDRRRRALRRGARLPRPVALDAALRRGRTRACPARADRLRPEVRPQVRGLGGARLAALPDVVGAGRRRARQPLGPERRGRVVRARGRRPRRRDHGLVDPARSRLHALQPHTRRRVPGLGRRVPPGEHLALAAGRDPLLLA